MNRHRWRNKVKVEGGKLYAREGREERDNAGNCYHCRQPVFVSEGQSYTRVTVRSSAYGEVVGTYPVHKKCRKKNAP